MSERVEKILANYAGENPGIVGNLRRLMNTGRLAGTGKIVILPVDQGFEHGPARSFAPNPPGYDPAYHPGLAVEAGCNGYAAPLGFIESIAREYAGRLPLILKVNNSDSLGGPDAPCSALTSAVDDALRLGCAAIGYTIYPGSGLRNQMYQDLRDLINDARAVGLPTIVWSYPRGAGLSKEGETAVDVVAYAAQIACQLGAHVVKVKPPTEVVFQDSPVARQRAPRRSSKRSPRSPRAAATARSSAATPSSVRTRTRSSFCMTSSTSTPHRREKLSSTRD
jgi:class I fructose-bisphosphate aldolase